MSDSTDSKVGRREFIGTAAAASAMIIKPELVWGTERNSAVRLGLLGCGGRGTGVTSSFIENTGAVVTAIGDIFDSQLAPAKERLDKVAAQFNKPEIPLSNMFRGPKAYEGLFASSDVDAVYIATPPYFHPAHLEAAIAAGKHTYLEKPVAVDPLGVRSVIATSELAAEKGLAIVAGTQRRHQAHYLEIMKRVHGGDIGDLVAGQCYWNMGLAWDQFKVAKTAGMSDMEWQCRNWFYTTWLSGDHICEQHVHNLDIMNWGIGTHPVQVIGMGGRQARTGPEYGNIFDHFACEFEYPNGVRVASMCKQNAGAAYHVCERLVGTKGQMYTDQALGYIKDLKGNTTYTYEGPNENPYYTEHRDLITSIREGKALNEAKNVAESTMCAVIGRMSAYTGRALKWDWAMNASKLDLRPAKYEFGDLPLDPVAIPGKTQLI